MANEIMNIQEQGNALALTTQEQIQAHIYTIRGMQVMLDKDLAVYYGITTSALNQAVKRNADRFPDDFMFQLTKEELQSILMSQNVMSSLKSQNVILESEKDFQNVTSNWGGTRKLPYAFTETGVSSLASVLRGPRASQTHVMIMRAFVAMRRYLTANAGVLQRLDQVEIRQLQSQRQTEQWVTEVNQRFDQILDRLDDGSLKAKMGVFFDQQMFDANVLVEELVSKAKKRIVLIDDYVTGEILQRFHDYAPSATIDCYVKDRMVTIALQQKFTDFCAQYPGTHCQLHTFEQSHDRWLIIDKTVYHFGASIKDLGKRWFSVDMCTEYTADELLARL